MQCTIVNSLFDVLRSMMETEKEAKDYGTGHLLYHSEMKFLEMVYRNPEANAIELSEALKVTRGAITQMGKRMEDRGFVLRFSKPDNRKEKYYRLTDLGKTLRQAHQQYHAKANEQMCQYLRSLTQEELALIMQFLGKLSELMPLCAFDCIHPDAVGHSFIEGGQYA